MGAPTRLPPVAFQFPNAAQVERFNRLMNKARVQTCQELVELAIQKFEDQRFIDPYSEPRGE